MKYCYLFACLLFALLGTSCNPEKTKNTGTVEFIPIKISPRTILGRIAATEYQYPNRLDCIAAATDYFGQHPEPKPLIDDGTSLVYSFKVPGAKPDSDTQIRFTFTAATSCRTVIMINYYELKKTKPNQGDTDNETDLINALDDFKKEKGAVQVQGAVQDAVAVNGKKPWRAIMYTKGSITGDMPSTALSNPVRDTSKQSNGTAYTSSLKLDGTFGIIINPAYP